MTLSSCSPKLALRPRAPKRIACYLGIAALCVLGIAPARAATFTVIHSFSATNANSINQDGADPFDAPVLGRDGNLYGTCGFGGAYGYGTVFKITPAGGVTTLYNFTGTNDGADPETNLLLGSDGNFYGTTHQSGPNGNGTIFKITPAGAFTILHAFAASAVNQNYSGNTLIQGADGDFYGTTYAGGTSNNGSIFKITPTGVFTTLHNFVGTPVDGAGPASLIQGSDGDFYGTTSEGGSEYDGTVFKITPTGTFTTIYNFVNGMALAPPIPLIAGRDGVFYCMTGDGGTNGTGTFFKITPTGTLTTISSKPADVGSPSRLVLGSDGNFYGTTSNGGANGTGSVFEVTPGGAFTTLYSFTAFKPESYVNADGALPEGGVVEVGSGVFYGTALEGGPNAVGTIFKIALAAAPPTITGFSPLSGPVGTTVVITGTHLTGTTVVGFQGKHATSFTVNAAGTQITTTVPAGAQTGPIAVLTHGIEAKSKTYFTVTP